MKPITRYAIRFQAHEDIELPHYAGSALRGMFGHSLKAMTCLTAKSATDSCRCVSNDHCLYRQLFESSSVTIQERQQDIPVPFVIEALGLPRRLKAGQAATFFMVIFGQSAHDEMALIKLVWRRALASGFGDLKARANLIGVEQVSQPLALEYPFSMTLQIQTPVRIQYHGKILGEENFCAKAFCRALMRRYQLIASQHGIDLSEKHWQNAWDSIDQVDSTHTLTRQGWARYSNRQRQKITQDGLVGTLILKNISSELAHYLYLGQWLHVGKGAVFGLGQYQIL